MTALTEKWLARRRAPATVATVATLDRSHWKDWSLVSQPGCDTAATIGFPGPSPTSLSQPSQLCRSTPPTESGRDFNRISQTVAESQVSQTSLAQTPGEVDLETFEERAAIINFDGGAPVEWAEALARLDRNKPPGGMTQRRWRQVLEDAGRFLDEWGNRAHELGWNAADLFGVHPQALDARVDLQGLAWLLEGRSVVALTAATAMIEGRAGARLAYRRRSMAGATTIWDLVP